MIGEGYIIVEGYTKTCLTRVYNLWGGKNNIAIKKNGGFEVICRYTIF